MSFLPDYSCSPALTAWITHRVFGRIHDWTPLTPVFVSGKGRSGLGSTALMCSEQGMSKAFLFLRGTPWVWCSAWAWFAVHGGFLQGLNKWAVLSLSTELSVGVMTPKACLCAQAGLGKALLHGFSAGILSALGKSLSVPSSCALVPGSNTSKRQLCSAACPHPLPYWCGSFPNHNCSVKHHNRRKTIHTLPASNTNTVTEVGWQQLMGISSYCWKALPEWNALSHVTQFSRNEFFFREGLSFYESFTNQT